MLGRVSLLGLALALVLGASAARAMPGAMAVDISPTVPYADDLINLHSDLVKSVQPVTQQVASLLRERCRP